MFVTRNQIMNALKSLLETKNQRQKLIGGFSRRFVTPDKLSGSASMPFICICKPKEVYPPRPINSLPAKRTFMVELIVWISVGQNQAEIPDEKVCDIMDFLDEALQPDKTTSAGKAQSLGGLVESCNIEGDVPLVPGDVDGNGMMLIPLIIVVP